jgi:hypothetical protein
LDEKLVCAKVHLSMLSSVVDAIVEVVHRLHVGAAAAAVYAAWPELHADVDALIRDVRALLVKLRALQ